MTQTQTPSPSKGRPPRIPLPAFRQLVRSLPPAKLAQIPPETLPENIPVALIDEVPLQAKRVVEDLLLAANTYHMRRRTAMEASLGDEGMRALDLSRTATHTATLRVFTQKLQDLRERKLRWNKSNDSTHLAAVSKGIHSMNNLMLDVRAEDSEISQAIMYLESKQDAEADYAEDIVQALLSLKNASKEIEQLLAEFYLIRLHGSAVEMNEKLAEIDRLEGIAEEKRLQIEQLRNELENTRSVWRRTLGRNKVNHQAEELQTSIARLAMEMKAMEVTISENDLTDWLDGVIDASLHPFTRDQATEANNAARESLYLLMHKYCAIQESSARQVARNPFLQVDPEQVIRYTLMSEQFILDYFTKKRHWQTAWLSHAAQVKMEDLDDLEKEIIGELKRSAKHFQGSNRQSDANQG